MSDLNPFLPAIIHNPDDDAPRLVYADWLEEHGHAERAEFIRIQIRRETLTPKDAEWTKLRDREREILARHEEIWRRELPKLPGVNWLRYWRGFVGGADVSHWKQLRLGHESLSSATPVQFLRVFSISVHQIPDLLQLPLLKRLRSLAIATSEMNDAGILPFANSPNLCNLRSLTFGGHITGGIGRSHRQHFITERGLAVLLSSPHLAQLSSLTFAGYFASEVAQRQLAERFGNAGRVLP